MAGGKSSRCVPPHPLSADVLARPEPHSPLGVEETSRRDHPEIDSARTGARHMVLASRLAELKPVRVVPIPQRGVIEE